MNANRMKPVILRGKLSCDYLLVLQLDKVTSHSIMNTIGTNRYTL